MIVQYENYAFIFPDDLEAFKKRYGVDVLWMDIFEGELLGIGPNDTEWRAIPADRESSQDGGKVVKFGSKD